MSTRLRIGGTNRLVRPGTLTVRSVAGAHAPIGVLARARDRQRGVRLAFARGPRQQRRLAIELRQQLRRRRRQGIEAGRVRQRPPGVGAEPARRLRMRGGDVGVGGVDAVVQRGESGARRQRIGRAAGAAGAARAAGAHRRLRFLAQLGQQCAPALDRPARDPRGRRRAAHVLAGGDALGVGGGDARLRQRALGRARRPRRQALADADRAHGHAVGADGVRARALHRQVADAERQLGIGQAAGTDGV
ncbi:MAG: hypothetical protein ABFC67_03945, partial [Mizugakiibacter sp.]|uniref:hypothetical protein n=1 Tax=Mizugakiibacter sp. TaxID=1972610 RepID=UPI00320CC2DC